jgi:hypothetical protein
MQLPALALLLLRSLAPPLLRMMLLAAPLLEGCWLGIQKLLQLQEGSHPVQRLAAAPGHAPQCSVRQHSWHSVAQLP